jgi:hypothetical protein
VVSKWDDKVTGTGMQEDTHVSTIGVLVTNMLTYCIRQAGDGQAGDEGWVAAVTGGDFKNRRKKFCENDITELQSPTRIIGDDFYSMIPGVSIDILINVQAKLLWLSREKNLILYFTSLL